MVRPDWVRAVTISPRTVLPLVHGAGDGIPAGVCWFVALEEELIVEVAVCREHVTRVGLFEDAK